MVVEKLLKVNPPSSMVPGRGLLVLPIFGARRRRNSEEIRDAGSFFRVSVSGVNIVQRGAPGGGPSSQAPSWRGQEWGRSPWPLGRGCTLSGPPSVIPEAS